MLHFLFWKSFECGRKGNWVEKGNHLLALIVDTLFLGFDIEPHV
jgi:hypothetical protein